MVPERGKRGEDRSEVRLSMVLSRPEGKREREKGNERGRERGRKTDSFPMNRKNSSLGLSTELRFTS